MVGQAFLPVSTKESDQMRQYGQAGMPVLLKRNERGTAKAGLLLLKKKCCGFLVKQYKLPCFTASRLFQSKMKYVRV